MIELPLFLKAIGIGMAIAAPVGPMSLLCMRRTLTAGWRHGLAVGAGIAIGDAIYGIAAALGLVGVSQFMLAYERPLHLFAGLFLIYLGLKTSWRSRPSDETFVRPSEQAWSRDLASAVLLTLTNPPTIIMFAAVFSALAPSGDFAPDAAFATVTGVFAGSLLWWCVVTVLVASFRRTINLSVRTGIDRAAGMALAAFGVVELRRAL
jgi:threonine/homoserine/homoserine lactone efflux protein